MNFDSNITLRAAVIGDPIAHSLSPKIHQFLLNKYNISGVYLPIQVSKNELASCVKHLVESGFAGFNVTLPHKEEIFKLCDFVSNTAKLINAVNTVIITSDQKIFGHNSDAEGFLNNLKNSQADFNLKDKNIFLIGAGGAAQALVYALIKSQVKKIFITNRSLARAENLIKNFSAFAAEKNCQLEFLDQKSFEKNLHYCDLLVNSTALGMVGKEKLIIDLENLKNSALVYDIVYRPLKTDLLKNAQNRGNKIVTGIGMLLEQALIGFEAWFKQKPEIDENLVNQAIIWSQS
ncbi:MAG: shikimate dehydrogenase [Rickettsiales bacterium]|nr:shikimate dehydrogenase [Rickettsiales bacterium]